MADKPVISIVTPSFNRAASLKRAVASVLAQTLRNFELIVVDDASTDRSADVVRQFQDPRIRLHRFDVRRGANPARNQGIVMARANVVTFLDSDDEFLPHRLERTMDIMWQEPRSDVLLSSFHTWKRGRFIASVNPDVSLGADELEHLLMAHAVVIAGSGITVRRELLTRCGGFTHHLRRMQDRELLLNIAGCQALSGREGARLLAEPDWVKYQSVDSISAPAHGFVEALGHLMDCHPDLMSQYGTLVRYHVARSILSQLVRGRPKAASRIYGENLRVPAFRFSRRELVLAYVWGRWTRMGLLRAVWTSARRAHDLSAAATQPATTLRFPDRHPDRFSIATRRAA